MFRRLDNANVSANRPHAQRTANSTPKQKLAASELVNEEEKPDNRGHGFHNTEDTSHQVHGVRLDAQALQMIVSKVQSILFAGWGTNDIP